MPIQAVCDHCSKRYSLDDSFAGRTVKCRTCHQSFTVPGPVAGGDADATPVAGRSPRPRGGGDDVLELKTEYAERASMPTITEPRDTEPAGGGDACPQCGTPNPPGTKRCGKCGKRLILPGAKGGGDDEGAPRKSRYKRKSRWMLKLSVLAIVLAGGAIGAGTFLAPRNMEKKWEATKAFWGGSFLDYLSALASFDMSLEGAPKPAEPEAAPAEATPAPEGPAEGAKVCVRGQVSAVEPGEAGNAPAKFVIQGTGGKTYRIVLGGPDVRLEQFRTDLGAGKPGPWGEAVGKLVKHSLDGTLNQVEAESFLVVEASALEGKPTLEEVK